MTSPAATQPTFLFLQGPHGPFFRQLAGRLEHAGAKCWRIGFNAGDKVFWRRKSAFIPFAEPQQNWPQFLEETLANKGVTDIVLYGDTRQVHTIAVQIARDKGLRIHVFEEGYLRPYWATYERGGSNGHSELMNMSVAQMQSQLATGQHELPQAPGHWGNLREHVFYGALYHWLVMFANRDFPNYRTHRAISVAQEFRLHLLRLLLLPWHGLERMLATARIKWGGYPYHVGLLQLEHDASFRDHSSFETMTEFLSQVISGFADHAPSHHHLVFKAHPLEDGRVPLKTEICRLASQYGIAERSHFVRGGKLARLLDNANSVVTVNSTAAQQALWRGLPVKAFGTAVYSKSELVSDQSIGDFFTKPDRPNMASYLAYRQFLLETSQVSGGFYAARGRRRLLRLVVDMMLRHDDPYQAMANQTAAPAQQLSVTK
jgi:capsular polysaccharide export protein